MLLGTGAVLSATEGGGLWIRPPGGCVLARVDCDRMREFTAFGARIKIGPRLPCKGAPSRSIAPESTGPIKDGARDALRRRKAIFAYFFWRLQKSMASGGTRPAGFSALEHHQKQTNGVWLPSCQVEVLKRRKEVQGCKVGIYGSHRREIFGLWLQRESPTLTGDVRYFTPSSEALSP
jgi:hypothetical protein